MDLLSGCCNFANGNQNHPSSSQGAASILVSPGPDNILLNHDFSSGLEHWRLNCCDGDVVKRESDYPKRILGQSIIPFAVVTNRNEVWQGFEQNITSRVEAGCTYKVSTFVALSGDVHGLTIVQALVKLLNEGLPSHYIYIARIFISESDKWEKLEGTFTFPTMADKIVFYFEADPPGLDMLIGPVTMSMKCSRPLAASDPAPDANIILNPQFDNGIDSWSGRDCKLARHSSLLEGTVLPLLGDFFASASCRSDQSNGIQQEITERICRKHAYEVTAIVRIIGSFITNAEVKMSLWIIEADLRDQHIEIAELQASEKEWVKLQGKFLLNSTPSRAIIYIHGPPRGIDILVNCLEVKRAAIIPASSKPDTKDTAYGVNIIKNSNMSNGLDGWFSRGDCMLSVETGSPCILPPLSKSSLEMHDFLSGRCIVATNRTTRSAGPAQIVTDALELYMTYQVSAWVRIVSAAVSEIVNITIVVDDIPIMAAQVEVHDQEWYDIGGSFRIEKQPSAVVVCVEGPSSGLNLMVAGLNVFHVDRKARFARLNSQIVKIRQRDVILNFTRSEGMEQAYVKVKQIANSFPFGSFIRRTNICNEDFAKFFAENFNWAAFENELKWSSLINSMVFYYQLLWNSNETRKGKLHFEFDDADELMEWCRSHKIKTRGHCIFWEREEDIHPWIHELNKNDLMIYIENRLNGLLTHFKEQFIHYDVNNEMLHGSFYKDRLSKEIRPNMFKMAHQLDPSTVLFVNECHVVDGRDIRSSPERYIKHIKELREDGAPVGGIGIQGHIDSPIGSLVCAALDKLSMLGLPIWFTELDVSSENEHVRADDLEVMLREAFAHPAVHGIVLGGFWELLMRRQNAHLVNAEGEINEAGKRYLDLKKEWLSEESGNIEGNGVFKFRGFHGTYKVEACAGSTTFSKEFRVTEGI